MSLPHPTPAPAHSALSPPSPCPPGTTYRNTHSSRAKSEAARHPHRTRRAPVFFSFLWCRSLSREGQNYVENRGAGSNEKKRKDLCALFWVFLTFNPAGNPGRDAATPRSTFPRLVMGGKRIKNSCGDPVGWRRRASEKRETASEKRGLKSSSPFPGPQLRAIDSPGAPYPWGTSRACPRAGWGGRKRDTGCRCCWRCALKFFVSRVVKKSEAPSAALAVPCWARQPHRVKQILFFDFLFLSLTFDSNSSAALSTAAAAEMELFRVWMPKS